MSYNFNFDNPDRVNEWIDSLSDEELSVFRQGQIHAYTSLVSQIRETKIKLLEKMCELDEQGLTKSSKANLKSKMHVLDLYDDFYTERVQKLQSFGNPPLLTSSDAEYA